MENKTVKNGLIMKKYYFNEIYFALNNNNNNKVIKYRPEFTYQIRKVDEDNFISILRLKIYNENFPFELKLSMCAEFALPNFEEKKYDKLIKKDVPSIMFPFMRSAVANITTTANIPPLILPIININNIKFD
ncbi:MAG: protein-export chaperone SecB [Christensenellales bacterium]